MGSWSRRAVSAEVSRAAGDRGTLYSARFVSEHRGRVSQFFREGDLEDLADAVVWASARIEVAREEEKQEGSHAG